MIQEHLLFLMLQLANSTVDETRRYWRRRLGFRPVNEGSPTWDFATFPPKRLPRQQNRVGPTR